VPDPTGYGRIVRSADGALLRIVEQKDATEDERKLDEINSGIYIVRADELYPALALVSNANAQGEYYLTDIIGILQSGGKVVDAWCAPSWEELHGINTVADLEHAAALLDSRRQS
jgi:bifunctional UDP-N-acetylglucosamine pyrophosphorylase/glucosamine-1-phosphate N-acetyltransferase